MVIADYWSYYKLIYISFGGLFPCEILVPDHATWESRERLGFVQDKVWGYKIDKHMVLCIFHTYFANGYTLNFFGGWVRERAWISLFCGT